MQDLFWDKISTYSCIFSCPNTALPQTLASIPHSQLEHPSFNGTIVLFGTWGMRLSGKLLLYLCDMN